MKTDIACDYAQLYTAAIEEGLGYLVYSQEGVVFTLNLPGRAEQYSLRLGDESFSRAAKDAIVKHFTGDATIAALFAALIECTMFERFNKGVTNPNLPFTEPAKRDPHDNYDWPNGYTPPEPQQQNHWPEGPTSGPRDFGTTKPPTPRGWGV